MVMRTNLEELLESVPACNACWLMADNQKLGIPFIPILPKPKAKFVFIGRDPSPNTAKIVGVRGGKSVFINEIFDMIDEASVPEELIYITDMCKCHWRTSRGTPWRGTKGRDPLLPQDVARACVQEWLFREVDLLRPTMIFSFGEELYALLQEYIIGPNPAPEKLSATKDKSVMDAELHFVQHGAFRLKLGSTSADFVPLRHPGNSASLSRKDSSDKRWTAFAQSRKRAIDMLRSNY